MSALDKEGLARSAEDLLAALLAREGRNADVDFLLRDPWLTTHIADAIERRTTSPAFFGLMRWMLESNLMSDLELVDKMTLFARYLQGQDAS